MSGGAPVTVGIDVGTSSARALAVDGAGSVVGRGEHALHGRRSGDRHEQDATRWWPAVAAACRAALDGIAAARVGAVATCATSGTIVLVDGAGRPLTPALMYDDGRARRQAAALGVPPSWALARLRWLVEHAAPPRGARLAQQADVVTAALAGRPVASDASHARKSGFDPERCAWCDAAARLPVELPAVVAPGTRLGAVGAAAARLAGIPRGTPIVAGMTDGCAAQIAAGALRPGDCNAVLGTTLVLKGCAEQRIDDHARGVYSHRAPAGGWLPGGASSSGAGVLPATFPGRDLDALGDAAARHERTPVLAYPLLGRGERFPFVAPRAHAFMLGAPADDGERAAALMQGVALVERLCVETLHALGVPTGGELTLTGGATRNRRWCQLRADALRRPARLPERTESAFGMAILAAAHVERADVRTVAARMQRTRATFEPRPAVAEHLDERYARLVAELRERGWLGAAP